VNRRAPVQAEDGKPQGTVSWEEHCKAWEVYAAKYGSSQDAECIAGRYGFGYVEMTRFLGRESETRKPWGAK